MSNFYINYLSKITKREWILLIIIFALCAININSCINRNKNNNVKYIKDSTEVYQDKKGNQYIAKETGVVDKNWLKKYNFDLYNEYKNNNKYNPLIITQTKTITKIDSIPLSTTIEKYPNYYKFNWEYSEKKDNNNYFNIQGSTETDSLFTYSKSKLNKMELASDLTLNIIENPKDKNTLLITAKSGNPRMNISNINGAVINPKKNSVIKKQFPTKRWGIGIQAGAGIGYDINNKKLSSGPYIGIGISYNILTW